MKSPIVMSGAALVPARLALASIASFWAVWLVLVTGRQIPLREEPFAPLPAGETA